MISKDFFNALDELEKVNNVKKEVFISTLETALTAAYKKNFGEASNALVKLDADKKNVKIIKYKVVVEEVTDKEKELSLAEARLIKKTYKIGDRVEEEVSPKDFQRIAVGTAKQVIMQKLREIEKENIMNKLKDKVGMFLSTEITRIDTENGNVYVRLEEEGILEGIMSKFDQIPEEKYYNRQQIKVYVRDLKDSSKSGPTILVTRSNTEFVKKLLEFQIPEIANNEIEIVKIAREAGKKTKVAIKCNTDIADPVGACVGLKSMRINNIIKEMNNEKVDIVMYSDDPYEYVKNAMSPASIIKVEEAKDGQGYDVYVPGSKLSLAIGKAGINVKLSAKLTGFKINVVAVDDYEEMIQKETEDDNKDKILVDTEEDYSDDTYNEESDYDDIMDIDDLFNEDGD